MKKIYIVTMTSLLFVAGFIPSAVLRAQKAYPVEVAGLLTRMPVPTSSSACYAASTKTTDANSGTVSIQDNGPAFKALNDEFEKIMRAAMEGAGTTPQQMAQARQGAATGTPVRDNTEMMKLVSQGQSACGQIMELNREFNDKVAKISKSPIENVKIGGNCPDVQQGGYAGPTCACMVAQATTYETARVNARDGYLQQVATLIQEYESKIKPLVVSVDDMVAKTKYGDAVANPAFKQMVGSEQRQTMAAVTTFMAVASSAWEDAAKQYAGLVNAKSGASTGCNHRK